MKHQKKKTAKAFKLRKTTAEEKRIYDDACWALCDPDVRARYEGRLVVVYQGRIVASGLDPSAIQEEAARLTGTMPGDLPILSIIPSLQEIPPDGLDRSIE